MKLRLFFLYLSAMATLLGGCRDDNDLPTEEETLPPFLSIAQSEVIQFQAAGGETTCHVKSNTHNWKAKTEPEDAASWISFSCTNISEYVEDGGSIKITVAENTGNQLREGSIIAYIPGTECTDTIHISQQKKNAIIASATDYFLPTAEDTIDIKVNTKATYTIPEECRSWIKEIPDAEDGKLRFKIDSHTVDGSILIQSIEHPDAEPEEITITRISGNAIMAGFGTSFHSLTYYDKYIPVPTTATTVNVPEWCLWESQNNFSITKNSLEKHREGKIEISLGKVAVKGTIWQAPDFALDPTENTPYKKLSEVCADHEYTILYFWNEKNSESKEFLSNIHNICNSYRNISAVCVHEGEQNPDTDEYGGPYNLTDKDKRIGKEYKIDKYPTVILYAKSGRIILWDYDYTLLEAYFHDQFSKEEDQDSYTTLSFGCMAETKKIRLDNKAGVTYNGNAPWLTLEKEDEYLTISVTENNSPYGRSESFLIGYPSHMQVNVSQAPKTIYGYYKNKEYRKLQSATRGKGIDLVITGDGFVKNYWEKNGVFHGMAMQAMEHFFSVEPFASYRNYFNVYMLAAISEENGIGNDCSPTVNNALGSSYGTGTHIDCALNTCKEYVRSIPGLKEPAVAIVILNSNKYAGTTYINSSDISVALCPFKEDEFEGIIHHEAGGHGFGLLADEYVNHFTEIPEAEKAQLLKYQQQGLYDNLDVTDDLSTIRWKDFIGIPRYASVKAYPGGYNYLHGVWRAEKQSCMINNIPYFNAPSRWYITRRIMELAGEPFTFSDFLQTDNVITPEYNENNINSRSAKEAFRCSVIIE